ncbi:proliferating cell nuclear antigen [Piptocephalis cylindrospora]|uniref:DNA sliding clamp PCNA n=1 Tax=Piptocephalis cylindrospora TaxID=1907219 RepID=A0A4V1IYL7_9FUNG|nr:proliferating cell nuclear antigen [Piptocephalis cylindrospora]|eukprot:RKP14999.1 proliferating cell nuclear antigen [Piptocephalis cylindrospora]
MLEARLPQGAVLKKIVDAIKEIVSDANFDCTDSGITLQAMDSSHVALVSLLLTSEAFDPYRCDRNLTLGINIKTLVQILKCSGNDDVITLRAEEPADTLALVFEPPSLERISEYEMKLMDIDNERLEIPDTAYHAEITMAASEFQRICRDMQTLSESVTIEATKEGVKFSAEGELGSGSVTLKQGGSIDSSAETTTIELVQPTTQTFSVKYLVNFSKSTSLAGQVRLAMTAPLPMLVEYKISDCGHLRFFLAPKIDDEE